MNRIVVVGASAAGLAAAETLRREGHTGTLTLVGDEPLAPYDRPPLSKQLLSGEWEPERLALRPAADLGPSGSTCASVSPRPASNSPTTPSGWPTAPRCRTTD